MRRVLIAALLVSSLGAAAVWAQQRRGPDAIVGGNWQAAPSSALGADASVAWFFDAGQSRVLACYSSKNAPTPVCHTAEFPIRK